MIIKSFEEINAWIEARKLTKRIYEITNEIRFSKDFELKDQIRRASVSIMANISEGFDSQSINAFIRYLRSSVKRNKGSTDKLVNRKTS